MPYACEGGDCRDSVYSPSPASGGDGEQVFHADRNSPLLPFPGSIPRTPGSHAGRSKCFRTNAKATRASLTVLSTASFGEEMYTVCFTSTSDFKLSN